MPKHRSRFFKEPQFEENDAAVESEHVVARTYWKVVCPGEQDRIAKVIPLSNYARNLAGQHWENAHEGGGIPTTQPEERQNLRHGHFFHVRVQPGEQGEQIVRTDGRSCLLVVRIERWELDVPRSFQKRADMQGR